MCNLEAEHDGDVDITTPADRLERWETEIENELDGLDFFESMSRYFVVEPCKSNHAKMVAEHVAYRAVLVAMLDAIKTKGKGQL